MPLVDHFHPPVYPKHSWESFHSRWAVALADTLGEQLPYPRFLVEVQTTIGDDFEVRIFDLREGKSLVGVVELVSPANKDRHEHCRAFAAKCLSYLHHGIGVVVVDIVSERPANLHNELMSLMDKEDESSFPPECHLYAVAYRLVRRDERNLLDLWPESLELDGPLPVLPLTLKRGPCVRVDLESAYTDTRRWSHI